MAGYIFRCDLSRQYKKYRKLIDNAVARVLKSGIYNLGREVKGFEDEFARYLGRGYGVAVASGTDALILALRAAGIRKGDEVITTAYAPTPVPTAVVLAGGVPVFADIESDTCLIDPDDVKKNISRKTRFLIPVHIFGYVCNMPVINGIARENRLTVVEDAAQAHGSTLGGKKAGDFGNLSCLSFYPTKNLGCYGDGGIVMTDDRKAAETLRLLRNYGKRFNPFNSEIVGYNSRLDEVQAAILRVKLRYLDAMNNERAKLANLYVEGLKELPIKFLKSYRNAKPNYHIMTILCGRGRDALKEFLESRGIQTNIYYPTPLHRMKAFKRYARSGVRLPVCEGISKRALALPLYPELKEEEALFIIDTIKRFFSDRRYR